MSNLLRVVLLWLATGLTYAKDAPDSILGLWMVDSGSAILAIERVADRYRVRLLSVREPVFKHYDGVQLAGKTRTDIHNADAARRNQPLEGMELASGIRYRDAAWQGDRIYDPSSGNSYQLRLRLEDADVLEVRGYLGWTLLGKTMYWYRLERYLSDTDRMTRQSGSNRVAFQKN